MKETTTIIPTQPFSEQMAIRKIIDSAGVVLTSFGIAISIRDPDDHRRPIENRHRVYFRSSPAGCQRSLGKKNRRKKHTAVVVLSTNIKGPKSIWECSDLHQILLHRLLPVKT